MIFLYNKFSCLNKVRFRLIIGLFFFSVIVFSARPVSAQESMLPDVSYTYLAKLIDTAKKYYPQVKLYQHRINIADLNLKKTKLSWFDIVSFSMYYSPTSSTSINLPTYTGYQVGMYINIASLIQKPTLIKVAKEDVEIAKLGQQEYDVMLSSDVKARYIKYIQATTILRMQSRIVLEAESIVKDLRYRFEKGELLFENYAKSLIYFSDNKKMVIDAESNLLVAQNSLETIVGKKLADIQ